MALAHCLLSPLHFLNALSPYYFPKEMKLHHSVTLDLQDVV